MHLVFHIFQGIGIAAALGIRPFLPGVVAGALAAGNVEIHFNGHGSLSFLQSAPMIFVLLVAAVVMIVVERGFSDAALTRRPVIAAIGLAAVVLAALYFAGSLAGRGETSWPGYPAGVLCAAVGLAATRPLLLRVRARLGDQGGGTLPLYAELAAGLLALLSIVAPPVGPIALIGLAWLLLAGRRRADQKYAGLRILR